MRGFPSPNLGVRRLAIGLALAGAIGGTWAARGPFRALQQRTWANAYFLSETAARPELEVRGNEDGWYMMDDSLNPERKLDSEWEWHVVKRFPRTADKAPETWEYLSLVVLPPAGAILLWLPVHIIAWIIAGFKIGIVSTTRAQALVLWACLAVTLAVLAYPPVNSATSGGVRKYRKLTVGSQPFGIRPPPPEVIVVRRAYVADLFSPPPDYYESPVLNIPGLAMELALIALIGGGLIKVLGAGRKAGEALAG